MLPFFNFFHFFCENDDFYSIISKIAFLKRQYDNRRMLLTIQEKEKLQNMYASMLHIRYFEQKVAQLFAEGRVHGTTHLYLGEEAVAVGVCSALQPDDVIVSTHRGHGHCIAKGTDLNAMMAELLGRRSGTCKGKGGSMHIADLAHGNLGANGIVGGGQPLAVGAALAIQMRGEERICVCFFGDGSTNEGSFHEALNLASVWRLPVLFVCENNLYAMSTSVRRSMNIQDISQRAVSYGMRGQSIDGNDIFTVYDAVSAARAYILKNGPVLLVANTYRYAGHSKSDTNVYRTQAEIDDWKQHRDPVTRMETALLADGLFSREALRHIQKECLEDIDRAAAWALQEPFPPVSDALEDVWA